MCRAAIVGGAAENHSLCPTSLQQRLWLEALHGGNRDPHSAALSDSPTWLLLEQFSFMQIKHNEGMNDHKKCRSVIFSASPPVGQHILH